MRAEGIAASADASDRPRWLLAGFVAAILHLAIGFALLPRDLVGAPLANLPAIAVDLDPPMTLTVAAASSEGSRSPPVSEPTAPSRKQPDPDQPEAGEPSPSGGSADPNPSDLRPADDPADPPFASPDPAQSIVASERPVEPATTEPRPTETRDAVAISAGRATPGRSPARVRIAPRPKHSEKPRAPAARRPELARPGPAEIRPATDRATRVAAPVRAVAASREAREDGEPDVRRRPGRGSNGGRARSPEAAPAGGGGQVSANSAAWRSQLVAWLQRNLRSPPGSNTGGVAFVSFSLTRQGRVIGASLARSAGRADLDGAALDLFRRGPLPAPPPDYAGSLAFTIPIRFQIR